LIAAGNEQAFERLFLAFKDRVYGIGLLYTESTVLAEEIVQDIFIKVWLKRTGLPAINNIDAWLFTITKNYAFTCLRNQQTRRRIIEDVLSHEPPVSGDADEKVMGAQTQQLIAEAMQLLSDRQQQAFQLIRLDGLSREEAAHAMGLSPNTVKMHLQSGIRIIRAYLLQHGGYIPLIIFLHRYFP
jgi:RNA polymerase sigma-70 factor (ECF subfamily)